MKIYKLSVTFHLFVVFLFSTLVLGLCLPTSFLKLWHIRGKLTWNIVFFSVSFIFTQILCLVSYLPFPFSSLEKWQLPMSHHPLFLDMKGKNNGNGEVDFRLCSLEVPGWLRSCRWGGNTRSRQGSGFRSNFQFTNSISWKERFPQNRYLNSGRTHDAIRESRPRMGHLTKGK